MRTSLVFFFVLTALTACGPSANDAVDPGEPSAQADQDGDGLNDAREVELGTDPQAVDSDGDGYWDGDEVAEGSDPTDPESLIYAGHWPYNPRKDQIGDPGWDSTPAVGTTLPRFKAIDQYGEEVDLYDFALQGRRIALEVGTRHCSPCKGLAEFYATGDASVMDEYPWFRRPDYEDVGRQIEADEIYWVTVLFTSGTPMDPLDNVWWHEQWPNHKIAVLFDADRQLKEYLDVVAMPHLAVLDEQMRLEAYSTGGPTVGFRHLIGQ